MPVTVYIGKTESGTLVAGFDTPPVSSMRFRTTGTEFDVRDFLERYKGLFRHYGGSVLSGDYRKFDGSNGVTDLRPEELGSLRLQEVK